jgi:hypothetical protein
MVKMPIGQHKVDKTLIDSGASLNLMMRKTIIQMGISLAELTPVHDTSHGITPITFLQANLDVFAWQISDMPGIPKEVIEHKLGIDPVCLPK